MLKFLISLDTLAWGVDLKTEINGININYTEHGAGEDILLLHGWGSSSVVWGGIINTLKDRYRLIALDWPGCGDSGMPKSPLNLDDYNNLVLEFCNKLNITTPVIMGHSHGGRVAISLLGNGLIDAKKAVLFDSAGIVGKKSLKTRAKIRSFKAIKGALSLPGVRNHTGELLDKARKHFGSADYKSSPEVMRKTLVNVVGVDLRNIMPDIKCPTLLIWGECDDDTPLENAKLMESLIKDCGLCVLKGCGHYSFLEKPYDTSAILNSFLG